MDFLDKMLAKIVEEAEGKTGIAGECPLCGGLVLYKWTTKTFECVDCYEYETDNLDDFKHWRIDAPDNK